MSATRRWLVPIAHGFVLGTLLAFAIFNLLAAAGGAQLFYYQGF